MSGTRAGKAARLVGLALAAASGPAAGDAAPQAGAALYRKHGCPVCHGARGATPAQPGYPVLAGQDRAYLAQQLRDLRSGLRSNGQSQLMRTFVERLGDEEIAALATWLAGLPRCREDTCVSGQR